MELLECIPNLSEGRRHTVVERLKRRVRHAGVRLLDCSSDRDHNRTVLTLVGAREALTAAALELAAAAIESIDLNHHDGVHPRVGALDVLPFVPLAATGMEAAIETAREAARRIADDLGVPAFLYGSAAARPRTLADLRRGGWRALARRIESGELVPDYGGRLHPTAGAVLVGARELLVAFNLLLDTDDVTIARGIAATVRQSAPQGLPGVLALGLFLESRGRAQVSVNLVDVEATSLLDLVERVSFEAERFGVQVLEGELIGLAPERALRGATAERLLLASLPPNRILESHLAGLEDRNS